MKINVTWSDIWNGKSGKTAECMVALGMTAEAQEALEIVVRQTQKKEEYSAMHDRAKAMLQILAKPSKGAAQ